MSDALTLSQFIGGMITFTGVMAIITFAVVILALRFRAADVKTVADAMQMAKETQAAFSQLRIEFADIQIELQKTTAVALWLHDNLKAVATDLTLPPFVEQWIVSQRQPIAEGVDGVLTVERKVQLADALERYFSTHELKSIANVLDLSGQVNNWPTKRLIVDNLLTSADHRGRIPQLLERLRGERPNVDWG